MSVAWKVYWLSHPPEDPTPSLGILKDTWDVVAVIKLV